VKPGTMVAWSPLALGIGGRAPAGMTAAAKIATDTNNALSARRPLFPIFLPLVTESPKSGPKQTSGNFHGCRFDNAPDHLPTPRDLANGIGARVHSHVHEPQ